MKKPTKQQVIGGALLAGLIGALTALIAACGGDDKCDCPKDTTHYKDEKCCTNKVGEKHGDCECTIIPRPVLVPGVDYPKDQGGPQEGFKLFEGGDEYELSITGKFLNDEWEGVEDTVKLMFMTNYTNASAADPLNGTVYKAVFNNGVSVIVENPELDSEDYYEKFKTTGDKKTIYLNINAINEDLNVFRAINGLEMGQSLQVKAAPVMEYNRARNVITMYAQPEWWRGGVRNAFCLVPLGVMVRYG